MRRVAFASQEIYHVYNRGVDKRAVILDQEDADRFIQSMLEFNTLLPIGSLYENSFRKKQLGGETSKRDHENEVDTSEKLVEVICYCFNPNHFHLILRQAAERGIEKFMQRFGTGYTMYFNKKYKRSGALFQGVFKSIHVDTDAYLLRLSAYVNLNFRAHRYAQDMMPLIRSSFDEYLGKKVPQYCEKNVVLGQLHKTNEYQFFAEEALVDILARKDREREIFSED